MHDDLGLATAAVAENRRVAALSGWSTTTIELVDFVTAGRSRRRRRSCWPRSSGLSVSVLTLVVFPSLAAALVGRFSSFGITLVAALGIGVITALLQLLQARHRKDRWDRPAVAPRVADIVPVLIIMLSPRSSAAHGSSAEGRR